MAETIQTLEQNKSVVRRFIEEFVVGGDESLADEFFAPDYVRHDPGTPNGRQDRDEFVAMLSEMRTAFPDMEVEIEEMVAEGDFVVFRAVERGTHESEFMGIPPTGNSFEITGMAMHRIEDGKLAETWANWDMLGMLQQLGVSSDQLAR